MRTKPIQTVINNLIHHIVYIEYQDGKPHAVITLYGDFVRHWDFDLNMNWGEFMYYNSGSGGSIKEVQGPQYVADTKGVSLWHSDVVKFNKYKPKNCRILKNPIRLKNSKSSRIDPFKFAYQEVLDIIYCKECNGHYHQDGCSEHMNMWEGKYYSDGTSIDE